MGSLGIFNLNHLLVSSNLLFFYLYRQDRACSRHKNEVGYRRPMPYPALLASLSSFLVSSPISSPLQIYFIPQILACLLFFRNILFNLLSFTIDNKLLALKSMYSSGMWRQKTVSSDGEIRLHGF